MDNFSNKKAELLNEILQSARSLNDNGFKNCSLHLKKSKRLLEKLIEQIRKEGITY